jgi:uncharacterized damage-inducible protein DinB
VNQPLAEIFKYNRWANLQILNTCRGLTDEQLDARAPGTSGPVRELLQHIAGAQQTFVLRTSGRQHEGELGRESAWPGFETLEEVLTISNDELVQIAESLDVDREVDLPFMGKVFKFPVSFFMVHAAEHGVEHRTEIRFTLAHLGIEAPDLDGWPYSVAAGHGQEVTPGTA